jgi:hypothetical protein
MSTMKRKNCFYDTHRFGQPQIRIYHKKGKGNRMPRYLLKCGCCNEKLEIYYSDDGLEIGGVNGAIEDWQEILLPLLLIDHKGDELIDRRFIMTTAKEKMTEIIRNQPDDSSYDEILKELAFARMVERGLEDSRAGRTISNDEMDRGIRSWQK